MGIFQKVLNFIARASIPIFKFENNYLFFKLKNDEFYKYELKKYDVKTRHDPFILEAYTLNTKDIFLEYIRVDQNTFWNGQAFSLYEDFFKEKLDISSFETIEKKEVENYTFETKRVNESFVLHMIYIYMVNIDIIIVDMKGELYKNLLFRLDRNYLYKFNEEEKGEVNFNISLVKENCTRSFFNVGD